MRRDLASASLQFGAAAPQVILLVLWFRRAGRRLCGHPPAGV